MSFDEEIFCEEHQQSGARAFICPECLENQASALRSQVEELRKERDALHAANNAGVLETAAAAWRALGHPAPETMDVSQRAWLDEIEELRKERDEWAQRCSDIINEKPGPTAWAYERACAATEKHRTRAEAAEAESARLREALREIREGLADESTLESEDFLANIPDIICAALKEGGQ